MSDRLERCRMKLKYYDVRKSGCYAYDKQNVIKKLYTSRLLLNVPVFARKLLYFEG